MAVDLPEAVGRLLKSRVEIDRPDRRCDDDGPGVQKTVEATDSDYT